MDIGEYTRNILIEQQKDGRWALMIQTNAFTASMPSSYVLLGYVDGKLPIVQLKDHDACPLVK